ncbi:MAG: response regulator transcription factor [Eubacterium sp.]|jgi:DNA-binding response OmpR family regulator|nr:response regulator transcription factor [Eubacterium sp.]
MNVLVLGQEENWVAGLQKLCSADGIQLYQTIPKAAEIGLLVTDFPSERAGKGIFADIPFLVISKRDKEEDILAAFAAGAEDYMVRPVSPEIARVRILRILKQSRRRERYGEEHPAQIHLTPNENRILAFLMRYPGKAFSREELIEGAISKTYEGYDRNVDNYIKGIRRKLKGAARETGRIETVHGVGYRYML